MSLSIERFASSRLLLFVTIECGDGEVLICVLTKSIPGKVVTFPCYQVLIFWYVIGVVCEIGYMDEWRIYTEDRLKKLRVCYHSLHRFYLIHRSESFILLRPHILVSLQPMPPV